MSHRILLIASLLSLAACGGGGGGSGSSGGGTPPPPPPPPASYRVSGTVTGLAAPVTLTVNGNALSVSANGAVTLVASLTAGSTYTVTVATQPTAPAQVCTVTNGAGTANADVSNVAIDCVTTPLALVSSTPADGGKDASRTDALTLTFSAALDAATAAGAVSLRDGTTDVAAGVSVSGATLTVTPSATLPRLVPLVLTVGPTLRGTHGEPVAQPVALRFTTRDGAWSDAVRIDSGGSADPSSPDLGADIHGGFVGAWLESTATGATAVSRRFAADTGWSTPVLMSAFPYGADPPRVAVNPAGKAAVVFRQRSIVNPSDDVVAARVYQPFIGWSPVSTVAGGVDGALTRGHQVAISDSGTVFAAWMRGTVPWVSQASIGTAWSTPDQIGIAGAADATTSVAADSNGNAIVAWDEYRYVVRRRIAAAAYSPQSLNWGGTLTVDGLDPAVAATPATSPRVTMDRAGVATAAWLRDSLLWVNRRSTAGDWGTPSSLGGVNGVAAEPSLAAALDGSVVAVWTQKTGPSGDIWFSRYAAGEWLAPAPLETADGAASAPRIGFDERSRPIAVWMQYAGTAREIRWSRFDPTTGWSPARVVDRNEAGDSQDAVFAVSGDGTAMVVWQQGAPGSRSMWARRFD